jgi:hypothetical protein
MAQHKDKATTDGAYADGDLVQIPLVNLELGPNYRSQLREMDSLVESVYQFGVLTPLWVEPHASKHNKYIVFAGRRRYEAARLGDAAPGQRVVLRRSPGGPGWAVHRALPDLPQPEPGPASRLFPGGEPGPYRPLGPGHGQGCTRNSAHRNGLLGLSFS